MARPANIRNIPHAASDTMDSCEPSGSSLSKELKDGYEISRSSIQSSRSSFTAERASTRTNGMSSLRLTPGLRSALRHRNFVVRRKRSKPIKLKKDELGKEKVKSNEQSPETSKDVATKLGFQQRMAHFTWTWFCMTMATGGIANALYSIPAELRFRSLYALGCTFFLLNIILFLFNIVMICIRFYYHPHTFKHSFLHPTESLFIPAAVISFGTILINITQYGVKYTGEWLLHAMIPLFWMYCGLAILSSWGIFLVM